MRRLWLILLLSALPATLSAQQAATAPKPGHPLDPADVATLSGKSSTAALPYQVYGTPYVYYSGSESLFGQQAFAPVSTTVGPGVSPLAFGLIGRRPVAIFRAPGTGLPPFFFVRGHTGFFATPRGLVFGFVGR